MVGNIDDGLVRRGQPFDATQNVPLGEILKQQDKGHMGVSNYDTIEQGKNVIPLLVIQFMNPILPTPNSQAMTGSLDPVGPASSLLTSVTKMIEDQDNDMKQNLLQKWSDNLRETEELIRQILTSPAYLQFTDFLQREAKASSNISAIDGKPAIPLTAQNVSNPAAVQATGNVSVLYNDLIRILDRISEVVANKPNDNSPKGLLLPLGAALIAGGAFAFTVSGVAGANPISGMSTVVEQLKTLVPAISPQDIVPLINLMIVPPLYINSWMEAVGQGKGKNNDSKMIHNFAKNIIVKISDPNFVKDLVRARGPDNLSTQDQKRLTSMLKVVFAGIALSLLYSLEVGTVQNGKFGGITEGELRSKLSGKFENLPNPATQTTEQGLISASLLRSLWYELHQMSPEDQTSAVNMLIAYLDSATGSDVETMLKPMKVMNDVVASTHFEIPKTTSQS